MAKSFTVVVTTKVSDRKNVSNVFRVKADSLHHALVEGFCDEDARILLKNATVFDFVLTSHDDTRICVVFATNSVDFQPN